MTLSVFAQYYDPTLFTAPQKGASPCWCDVSVS